MTNDLFKPSKEMREYDALRANAEKAELIRAAEVFKNYCLKHRSSECKDETSECLLTSLCDLLPYWSEVCNTMIDIVDDVRGSDD